jgi:hypothetical protein
MFAHIARRIDAFRSLRAGGALRAGRTAGIFIAFLAR